MASVKIVAGAPGQRAFAFIKYECLVRAEGASRDLGTCKCNTHQTAVTTPIVYECPVGCWDTVTRLGLGLGLERACGYNTFPSPFPLRRWH